jgi:hypothetical protein
MSTRLFSYEDREEIARLTAALEAERSKADARGEMLAESQYAVKLLQSDRDALLARAEKAEGRAQQFERDWYDAKAEFGAASARFATTIAAREQEIAALRTRLRRDMVAGLSARRALSSGTPVIELLRKAIEAYTTEGQDDGPNDGPEEKALAELLAAIDDFNGSHRAVGAKWLRVMAAVPAFLSASADQVRALRVAWEAFESAEYTESGDGPGLFEPAERKPVAGWEIGHVPGYSARRAAPILRRGPVCVRATESGWEMIAESDEDDIESIQITSETAPSLESAQLAAEDALRAIADQIYAALRGGQP